ncbi:hypothetical protein D3C80_512940 [compost metagenome]
MSKYSELTNKLFYNKGEYSDIYRVFPYFCILIIPCFYTFIIYPFYKDESLYQWFLVENVSFWCVAFFVFAALCRAKIKLKLTSKTAFSNGVVLLLISISILLMLSYLSINILLLGWSGFFSGCHYCGASPIGGDSVRNIFIFDYGTVFVLLLPFILVRFGGNKLIVFFYLLCVFLIIYYLFKGSYRNQLLPIITQWTLIVIFGFKYKKVLFALFLCLSPIAAIAMAFYHYFGGDKPGTDMALYDYFALNEFYSNYNNFKIYNYGFELNLPFSGASYIGPILHRLSAFIDTGFKTSASQMASYMSDGIGYGFSPLLEGLLNFGDFYFVGAVFIGVTLYFIYILVYSSPSDLIAVTYFSLFVFFMFNINRVDYTAAFNVFFHKLIICMFYFYILTEKMKR